MALHVSGRGLPDEQLVEYWIVDGAISLEPVDGADTVFSDGWIIPGLVDAHCHVGIGPGGPVDVDEAVRQAETERRAGVLLIRDAGSPVDTRAFDDRADLPRIIRAGQHLARTKRYIPGLPINVDDEDRLPEAVAAQAVRGDGWVKLVGDWIDRGVGDLAPLWSDDVLKSAIDAAHANGARVTAHVFGEEALPGLINAGIDCIEHGTGITDDIIAMMLANGTALVPTLINIDNFPGIADSAAKYPTYAAHMRALHATCRSRIGAAREAGVPIYAGTDAGGMVAHGRIADEVDALSQVGLSRTEALGAACWDARRWLGAPVLEHGASADLVCFADDPRSGPEVLGRPDLVMLRGRVY
ncbi:MULTISPECIES: amidohydrolase family protein [unclassified Mycobacterium]|uniref:amidohydrolase family protein n=1 Tax=unclassified Mycobacterium TaxID=2642494 RepID=UPI00040868B6|nr:MULTISPECIES: amidohydrolase family protein [unclassified Mycobacterium]